MDVKLSKIASDLFRNISPVREIMNFADPKRLLEYGVDPANLISFGGGWVNHKSPKLLIESYSSIINDPEKFHFSGGYSPTNGEPLCKEAIVKFEQYLFEIDNLSDENIVIGQSSSHLTSLLFRALLDDGDKICMLDPSYCNYPLQLTISSSAKIIRFPVIDESNYQYNANHPEVIKRFCEFLLLHKPKVVLLVSPDNPTSQILSDDFIKAAHNTVKEYGGVIVVDFAYKTLIFGPIPEYYSWGPDNNFISIHSNSKWCRGLGRRLGWIEAPKYVIDSFESLQNSTILCPDRLHQMAFIEFMEKSLKDDSLKLYFEETRNIYKQTAKVLSDAIEKYINLPYLTPEGGLYTCVRIHKNSAKFVEDLLIATGVLLVPGWGFGKTLAKSVRISFGPLVYDHDKIVEGIQKTGDFIKSQNIK